jgi:alkylhydroperoxidase/carboxymuconolactone decarboxylase family protein YurZ
MTTGTVPQPRPESPSQSALSSVAAGDAPVLERLVAMNLDSLATSGLDDKTYYMVRLAALVAMDAAPVSYLINLGLAADSGMSLEEAQGTLIAIAPVVGSARVASAAGKVLRAFGLATAAGLVPEEEPAGA